MDESFIVAQLRDIRGLDAVPWWPPGPGWWLALAGVVALGLLAWRIVAYFRRDWRDDARRQLRDLRRRIGAAPGKTVLAEFSELLRRIAMARYGRDECAGLFGQDWLDWLETHDPKRFAWSRQADLLLDSAYAPPDTAIDEARLRKLLKATRAWVDAELPKPPQAGKPRYLPAVLWRALQRRKLVAG